MKNLFTLLLALLFSTTISFSNCPNPPEVSCPDDIYTCNLLEEIFLESLDGVWPPCTDSRSSFSGPGVIPFDAENGLWDFHPSVAGIGVHEITYTYTEEEGCSNSCSFIITVGGPIENTIYQYTCDENLVGVEVEFYYSSGCDSIVTYITELASPDEVTVYETTCDEQYVGEEVIIYLGSDGCDSIVTVVTELLESYDIVFYENTCDPDAVGNVDILTAANGCDSIVTIEMVYIAPVEVTVYQTTCDPEMVGEYVGILTSAAGCDSIVTVIVSLLPSYDEVVFATTCNPDDAGITVENLTTVNGCDSIVTTYTSLLSSSAVTINTSTCNPDEAGTTVEVLIAANGCDSVVTTNATLLPSYNITINNTTSNPAEAGTEVFSLSTVEGCDSIVTVITTLIGEPNPYASIPYFTEFIFEADQYWNLYADQHGLVQTLPNPKPGKKDDPTKTNIIFSALDKKNVGVGYADLSINLQSGISGRDVTLEYLFTQYEKKSKPKKNEVDVTGIYYVDATSGVQTFISDYEIDKKLKVGSVNLTQWASSKGITLSNESIIRFAYQGKAEYDPKKYNSGGMHLEMVHVYQKSTASSKMEEPELADDNSNEMPQAKKINNALANDEILTPAFDVTVYPNPVVAGQRFNIQLPKDVEKEVYIEMIDIMGRRIDNMVVGTSDLMRQTVSFSSENINVSGTYFINVVSGENKVTKRIQVVR